MFSRTRSVITSSLQRRILMHSSLRQHEQSSIEAKKGIVAFPSEQQRRDGDNAFSFDEGEVYGLNILVTNGEKIVRRIMLPQRSRD